jgi:hypothetical protein
MKVNPETKSDIYVFIRLTSLYTRVNLTIKLLSDKVLSFDKGIFQIVYSALQ